MVSGEPFCFVIFEELSISSHLIIIITHFLEQFCAKVQACNRDKMVGCQCSVCVLRTDWTSAGMLSRAGELFPCRLCSYDKEAAHAYRFCPSPQWVAGYFGFQHWTGYCWSRNLSRRMKKHLFLISSTSSPGLSWSSIPSSYFVPFHDGSFQSVPYLTPRAPLANRRVQHYGFVFDYSLRRCITATAPMPPCLEFLLERYTYSVVSSSSCSPSLSDFVAQLTASRSLGSLEPNSCNAQL
jgi:hypothetical protein